jgi:hypothetical protein
LFCSACSAGSCLLAEARIAREAFLSVVSSGAYDEAIAVAERRARATGQKLDFAATRSETDPAREDESSSWVPSEGGLIYTDNSEGLRDASVGPTTPPGGSSGGAACGGPGGRPGGSWGKDVGSTDTRGDKFAPRGTLPPIRSKDGGGGGGNSGGGGGDSGALTASGVGSPDSPGSVLL